MSCRSLLSCLLFLFRAWIGSFGSSSGFLRRRFAFHSSRANVRRLPHEYFVKRTRPNTRKNGNGRRWTLSPSRADENYPAFQWPLIFTRPLKRSISRSFFLFFDHLQPFFPAVQGFTPYARSSPLERIRSCFHPAFWRSKNEANPRFRFAKKNNFTQFRLLRISVLRIRGQRSLTILRSKVKRWRLLTSFWPIVTASSKDLPRHPLVDKRGAYPRKSNAPPWHTHIHTHIHARAEIPTTTCWSFEWKDRVESRGVIIIPSLLIGNFADGWKARWRVKGVSDAPGERSEPHSHAGER